MFSMRLLKIIGGFCGMILLGLISLVIVDSLKDKDNTSRVESQNVILPPVANQTTTVPATLPSSTKKPVR
ncbi:MAG: hypothetical protein V4665_02265 [Patescibacteria group bacterium]